MESTERECFPKAARSDGEATKTIVKPTEISKKTKKTIEKARGISKIKPKPLKNQGK